MKNLQDTARGAMTGKTQTSVFYGVPDLYSILACNSFFTISAKNNLNQSNKTNVMRSRWDADDEFLFGRRILGFKEIEDSVVVSDGSLIEEIAGHRHELDQLPAQSAEFGRFLFPREQCLVSGTLCDPNDYFNGNVIMRYTIDGVIQFLFSLLGAGRDYEIKSMISTTALVEHGLTDGNWSTMLMEGSGASFPVMYKSPHYNIRAGFITQAGLVDKGAGPVADAINQCLLDLERTGGSNPPFEKISLSDPSLEVVARMVAGLWIVDDYPINQTSDFYEMCKSAIVETIQNQIADARNFFFTGRVNLGSFLRWLDNEEGDTADEALEDETFADDRDYDGFNDPEGAPRAKRVNKKKAILGDDYTVPDDCVGNLKKFLSNWGFYCLYVDRHGHFIATEYSPWALQTQRKMDWFLWYRRIPTPAHLERSRSSMLTGSYVLDPTKTDDSMTSFAYLGGDGRVALVTGTPFSHFARSMTGFFDSFYSLLFTEMPGGLLSQGIPAHIVTTLAATTNSELICWYAGLDGTDRISSSIFSDQNVCTALSSGGVEMGGRRSSRGVPNYIMHTSRAAGKREELHLLCGIGLYQLKPNGIEVELDDVDFRFANFVYVINRDVLVYRRLARDADSIKVSGMSVYYRQVVDVDSRPLYLLPVDEQTNIIKDGIAFLVENEDGWRL